jgi:curved DNA-binding protein
LEGVDLYCAVPVTPSEAVLGSAIEVPTLDGMVKMNLPRGVRHGQRLRLSNKGYPINRDRRGDQIVEIQIATPTQLSTDELALYEQLRAIESFDPRANLPI